MVAPLINLVITVPINFIMNKFGLIENRKSNDCLYKVTY